MEAAKVREAAKKPLFNGLSTKEKKLFCPLSRGRGAKGLSGLSTKFVYVFAASLMVLRFFYQNRCSFSFFSKCKKIAKAITKHWKCIFLKIYTDKVLNHGGNFVLTSKNVPGSLIIWTLYFNNTTTRQGSRVGVLTPGC